MAEPRDGKPQDEGVLARWSRRKQAARVGGPAQPADSRLPADAEDQAPEVRPEVPAMEERADLPDPDTLDASSDFKPFLRPGIPVEMHRAALRRLWRLDPFYSRHDGLSDYCEDFTDQAATLKGVRTAWRVGRGLLDQIDKAAERRPETASAETTPAELPPDPTEPAPTEAKARPGAKAGRRTRRPLPKRV